MTAAPAEEKAAGPLVWAGFAMMCVGMFMAILDIQVVATSLPTIQSALGIRPDQMSWVQTAYLIAEIIAIPLTGFLTRVLTMRWLFVAAVSVFTLASIGCAASSSFETLIAWRVLQGFSGGTLIPAVFSAVFLLFPARQEALATTIAGVLAVLAPTVGPIAGGWITSTYSWHWLFLINVAPGVISAVGAVVLLRKARPDWGSARAVDLLALVLMGLALSSLEIALKEAPGRGWTSALVLSLLATAAVCGATFAWRTLRRSPPIVELRTLADPRFAVACLLSFVLGIGLFGSTYLMPVFLALVRGHSAVEIGAIMLVTGVAQLATAPLAVFLERRVDARLLAAAGFVLFAIGLAMSSQQDAGTDFKEMFWPQIVRGVAIMFCLLPPTRLALGHLPADRIPDASGLFNLMRNLGGAIGIALIDTVIYSRAPEHGRLIADLLRKGDVATAKLVGIPLDLFQAQIGQPVDADTEAMVRPMVESLALAQAINDAWLLVAALTLAATLGLILVARGARPSLDRVVAHP
ncbi:DHA2 family multidrug resistance protein [Caulobacter ginsengisoli]|uniref:DHA2 family multidrug resistance protein n=1 Tax=Caulobacter ginsengisoli TaxID=400775 RepID=A0ABU0IQM5_9CAUL|nr:DHA2 family efflux MFS transporter permease subunit [Caulobacter ginsengisoli]MDQ0464319.1 DHA2 family multidrug resistance protein [Caulobacter ginsengisoli]